ncbi:MAG: tRNA (mnm(5)s(2)U34)-methyltransferase [Holdemanella porci]
MRSMVEISHDFLKPALHVQAVCIDATLGNGKDSLFFLNQNVKKVIAFEIQKEAFEKNTIKDIRFKPYLLGHEHMDQVIQGPVDAIVFNFGYCPGLNQDIYTMPNTSVLAIQKGLSFLRKKGRMALVLYPHKEGKREAEGIELFLNSLDTSVYTIVKVSMFSKNDCPYFIGIEKGEEYGN